MFCSLHYYYDPFIGVTVVVRINAVPIALNKNLGVLGSEKRTLNLPLMSLNVSKWLYFTVIDNDTYTYKVHESHIDIEKISQRIN